MINTQHGQFSFDAFENFLQAQNIEAANLRHLCVTNYHYVYGFGEEIDSPTWPFPQDGTITVNGYSLDNQSQIPGIQSKNRANHYTKPGGFPYNRPYYQYNVVYTLGKADIAWIEAKKKNYFDRLQKEGKLAELEPEEFAKRNSPTKNQKENAKCTYVRHSVSSDGDCGYTAFGISRLNALKLLKEKSNPRIANIIAPAVKEPLITEEFFNYLRNKKAIPANISLADITANIDEHTRRLDIVLAYLEYDIDKKQIDLGWAHPAVLQALADIQKIRLRIWRLGADEQLIPHSKEYSEYTPEGFTQTTDILFVNDNHFERLELFGVDIDNVNSKTIYPRDRSLGKKDQNPNKPEVGDTLCPRCMQNTINEISRELALLRRQLLLPSANALTFKFDKETRQIDSYNAFNIDKTMFIDKFAQLPAINLVIFSIKLYTLERRTKIFDLSFRRLLQTHNANFLQNSNHTLSIIFNNKCSEEYIHAIQECKRFIKNSCKLFFRENQPEIQVSPQGVIMIIGNNFVIGFISQLMQALSTPLTINMQTFFGQRHQMENPDEDIAQSNQHKQSNHSKNLC